MKRANDSAIFSRRRDYCLSNFVNAKRKDDTNSANFCSRLGPYLTRPMPQNKTSPSTNANTESIQKTSHDRSAMLVTALCSEALSVSCILLLLRQQQKYNLARAFTIFDPLLWRYRRQLIITLLCFFIVAMRPKVNKHKIWKSLFTDGGRMCDVKDMRLFLSLCLGER